ncbi:MAG: threonine/serine exporter family protein [Muribaculaceae bacterium]|nr:threonine/serine exporter family protein [Muribaculaceae bacterium]
MDSQIEDFAESVLDQQMNDAQAFLLMDEERLSQYSQFLAVYASYMLGCGATCIRINKNIRRMANAVRLTADMIILSHHVTVICTDMATGLNCQHTRRIAPIGISFEINTRLSELSWKLAERKIDMEEAENLFYRIILHRKMPETKITLLVVIANASFCRLFGGDFGAMLIVAVATLLGFSLKVFLTGRKWDAKPVCLICSFVSALTAAGMTYLPLTSTPDWAISASVLYLIPGIPYINSISDCLDGHYLCALGRFIHAVALTVCIALGLTAGILLANKALII